MRRARLILCSILAVSALALRADADAIVVTQAMKASTIAEIFVEEASVRIEIEIGAADVRAFRNVIPDAHYEHLGYAPLPVADRRKTFLAEELVVLADGEPLSAKLALKLDRRVERDVITGNPLPVAPDEGERVLRLDLVYPLETKPSTLTIRRRNPADTAAAIGFMTYHRGLPVMDFRYLARDATLDLDWDDPWHSQFRNRNLHRQFKAPLNAYLYVEPFEVRQEIIVRPRDLQHWVDLGLEGREVIRAEEQAELKEKVVAFLLKHNPVTVDGVPVKLALDRVHFIRRTLRMTGVIDPPEDLDVNSATLGVIFYAPTQSLAQSANMRWDLWSPRIQSIPAYATDEAGGMPTTLTPDDPMLEWKNFLKNPSKFALTEIPSPTRSESGELPFGSLVCIVLGVALALRLRRTSRQRDYAVVAAAVLGAIVLWPYLRVDILEDDPTTTAEVDPLLSGLLNNVYRAFDRREDEIVYDRLARSVAGDLLQTAYLEIRRGMELENQGGARVKVTGVELVESDVHAAEDGKGFAGECTWIVSGSVGHWGHIHKRTNQYTATIRIVPVDGEWKITTLEMLDEERLPNTPGR